MIVDTTAELRSWALTVKRGDLLRPKALWNQTDQMRRLSDPVEVRAVHIGAGSQTGVTFCVWTVGGGSIWIDAGWFERPDQARTFS